MNNQSGYLEIFIGPMFAGKTSKLLELSSYFNKNNITTIALTHSDDVRYSIDKLSTHNGNMIKCYKYKNIVNLIYNENINLDQVQNILIDEGQFFDDLNLVIDLIEIYKKHVYVFGLDGDFNRNKFGKILDLIPYCDKVTKLHSICSKCRKPGIFSKRLVANQEQTLVGTSKEYTSLCRNCYLL
jgi:thymidine kinase